METQQHTDLSDCAWCKEPLLLSQPVAHSPSCNCLYHTNCLLFWGCNQAAHFYYSPHITRPCPGCDTSITFHTGIEYSNHDDSEPEAEPLDATAAQHLPDTPAFRADVKTLKLRLRERRKASGAYKRTVKDARQAWKTSIAPILQGLRDMKRAAISSLKTAPTAKSYQTQKTKYSLALARFQKKYPSLTRQQLYSIVPRERGRWWRKYREQPAYIFRLPRI